MRHNRTGIGFAVAISLSLTAEAKPTKPMKANTLCRIDSDDLNLLADDMALPSEAAPSGLAKKSYGVKPRLNLGNKAGSFTAFQAWGQVYRTSESAEYISDDVDIRNFRAFILYRGSQKWELIQDGSAIDGRAYVEDFTNDENRHAIYSRHPEGFTRIEMQPGRNFHFWPDTGRKLLKSRDIRGVFITMEARVAPRRQSQRSTAPRARFVLSAGADYWLAPDSAWDNMKTNNDAAIGRFKVLHRCWRRFTMTTLPIADIARFPPPM